MDDFKQLKVGDIATSAPAPAPLIWRRHLLLTQAKTGCLPQTTKDVVKSRRASSVCSTKEASSDPRWRREIIKTRRKLLILEQVKA